MSFKQVIIKIDSKNADKLSEYFMDTDALSVTIEDQYEGTELEQAIFNEPGMEVEGLWDFSKLLILFDQSANIAEIMKQVEEELAIDFAYVEEEVDDQDWVQLTKNQFQPIMITEQLFIVPSWHEVPRHDAINIILDPGLAFGTGSHPTTNMCAKWLFENVGGSTLSLLDYGCGSGILAIIAKKLGVAEVVGVDIDAQAIEASIFNAQNNNVSIKFLDLQNKNLVGKYEVVVANILSNPLKILAPILALLCANRIILSGILVEQAEMICAIYATWFEISISNQVENWVLLEGRRKIE